MKVCNGLAMMVWDWKKSSHYRSVLSAEVVLIEGSTVHKAQMHGQILVFEPIWRLWRLYGDD